MIVVDTSAIIAIISQEEEYELFAIIMRQSRDVLISDGTAVELLTVASRADKYYDMANRFLDESIVSVVPVDSEQIAIAGEAYRKYGKGNHPARLNFGDVFAYALAKQRNLPLLYKGDDFSKTDISPVSGYFHYGVPK